MKKILITAIVAFVLLNAGVFAWISQRGGDDRQEMDLTSLSSAVEKVVTAVKSAENEAVSEAEEAARPDPSEHVYAHRGVMGEQFEHSFKAYDKAISEGARYIEQDVVISQDGTLYLSHDETPARLTGKGGSFSDLSDETINELRTRAGEPVLRLEDVFERYGESIMYLIELKSKDNATVDAFSDLVDRSGLAGNMIVQCFEPEVLEALEERYPDMPKLCLAKTESQLENALACECADIVSVMDHMMSEENRDRVHDAGKLFSVWTLNSEEWIRRAIEMEVDSYFTDEVARAIRLEEEYRK